ncbi:FimV/HubP family polar landmark protein [Castellaniella sp.]|uniref:FimV/HubP family polar landmark protein n=1 Tax=Castellaniella sp. TaxID=1955812 RepID=UPI002AFEF401|nr:FimV/HubP family polar landmark protein [Castellaniella sp.]
MVGAARLIGGLLSLACLVGSPVHAADFGHARLVSTAGAPLLITLPITGLTPADLQTLSARPAPAADWANAGLTPPVALDSLIVSVAASPRPGASRILRIHSNQPFVGSLADLLLDVQTASGQQRHQVSLLVPGPVTAVAPPAGGAAVAATQRSAPATGAASAATSSRRVPAGTITVRRGDTMFAVARRHAVDQVSVYQLMLALQRANPQAFIHDNINLLRSDTVLAVPSIDDMLSISDAEARRQFVAQTAAFNRLRGGLAAADAPLAGQAGAGDVAVAATPVAAEKPVAADRLQLSQTNQSAADAQAAQGHALKDAESRVGQLQDNVQHLNQALQAQGEAARDVVADGAQAVTASIGKVASAISEASREAAAQADAQLNAQKATQAGSEAAPLDRLLQRTEPLPSSHHHPPRRPLTAHHRLRHSPMAVMAVPPRAPMRWQTRAPTRPRRPVHPPTQQHPLRPSAAWACPENPARLLPPQRPRRRQRILSNPPRLKAVSPGYKNTCWRF